MDISRMGAQAQITSLEELSCGPAGAAPDPAGLKFAHALPISAPEYDFTFGPESPVRAEQELCCVR